MDPDRRGTDPLRLPDYHAPMVWWPTTDSTENRSVPETDGPRGRLAPVTAASSRAPKLFRQATSEFEKGLWKRCVHIGSFEACSSFTRVTACQVARPPFRGLCREVPIRPVSQPNRPPAIESNHQLFEWVLPPLVICPFRAHTGVPPHAATARSPYTA